jgi:Immunity protein 8
MSIELEYQGYWSSDIDRVSQWEPKHNSEVFFVLQFDIGLKGLPGSNSFQALFATREGLAARVERHIPLDADSCRILYLIEDYSWSKVEEIILATVEKCRRDSWEESVAALSKYFHWEYENYEKANVYRNKDGSVDMDKMIEEIRAAGDRQAKRRKLGKK